MLTPMSYNLMINKIDGLRRSTEEHLVGLPVGLQAMA
jgi:hypothetical protein